VNAGPPEETHRLFVCVDPSAAAVADLGAVVDGLEVSRANVPGRSTRLAARDRWHVTLVFFGDVPVRRTERIVRALDAAAAGQSPVPVRFAGGGTFGRGEFTILWAGVEGELGGLATTVRAQLRRARIFFDAKPFRPHLTISRPGSRLEPSAVAADVATLAGYVGPVWTVGEMHLVMSELGPQPVYTPLHTARLGGPA
jgi:2'-5' RNA ligase